MSNLYDDFIHQVDRGRADKNEWIPLGLPRFGRHIGLARGIYYLVGGESGTGKTSLVDQLFVLNIHNWYQANKHDTDKSIRIVYRSMERSKTYKIAKWVCQRLWLKHDILLDVPSILGWKPGDHSVTDEIYEKIKSARQYFERMFEILQITDGTENPYGMYLQCKRISLSEGYQLKSNGDSIFLYNYQNYKSGKKIKDFTFDHYDKVSDGIINYYETVTVRGTEHKVYRYQNTYFPDDPDRINLAIADHLGKFENEQGLDNKGTLDKASDYFQELRDIFGWSIIPVSQFNRNISDMRRRINTDLAPEKQDFKGSGNMYEDADFVVGLFNPHESGLSEFRNYDITKFINRDGFNRFRSIHTLKNTYGIDNFMVGLNFIGEHGYFREVPKPDEITQADYYRYANLREPGDEHRPNENLNFQAQ